MRPLKLAIQAFGPFAGEQVLDFRVLGHRSLFLVHGPTGAGKTSILDAMCFALYGETSGGERDARRMRSDHARFELPTRVTLDFSLGDQIYRVTRSPEQERPKKRGKGHTRQSAKATLWCRTGLEDDRQEGRVLASQWSQVTREVERLLGFRSDQFRQVVMLPQGQFRRLLAADSRERQAILEILFQTETYRRIEEALKDAARSIQDKIEKLQEQKGFILNQAGADSEGAVRDRKHQLQEKLRQLEAEAERLAREQRTAEQQLAQARQDLTKIEELEKAEEDLSLLLAEQNRMARKEVRLTRARQAQPIRELEQICCAREQEYRQARDKLRQAETSLEQARLERKHAQEELEGESQREQEREQARLHLDELEKMKGRVKELEQAAVEFEGWVQKTAMLQQSLDQLQKQHQEHLRQLDQVRQEREQAGKDAARQEALQMELQTVQGAHEHAERLSKLRPQLERNKKEHEQILQELQAQEQRVVQARQQLERLEADWRQAQAALLARQLVPGAPCPVCGSTHHPSPARAESSLPDEKTVDQARQQLEIVEKERDEVREREFSLRREITRLESEIKILRKALGELAGKDLSFFEDRLQQIQTRLKQTQEAREREQKLKERLQELEREESRLAQKLKGVQENLDQARNKRDRQEAIVQERQARVPTELRVPGALEQALKQAEARLLSLVQAWKQAQETDRETAQKLAVQQAALKKEKAALEDAHRRFLEARRDFISRLEQVGFRDQEDFHDSCLEPKEMEGLEKEVDEYRQKLGAARERAARARKAAQGLIKPDLEALEQRLQEAKERLEQKKEELVEARGQFNLLKDWLEQLQGVNQELQKQEALYRVMGRVSEVANGNNSLRITFQRFVLAALLDDVLAAASRRLWLMSRERFQLHRAREQTDRRTAGGLDLMVSDIYTGTSRPVNTLSGGESFLASLSLAMGLADVVQAYSGGIRLETIFVDEGFGSLDPEALDLALRALVDLQKGGRLVGIISHVPELKERIDARLEVIPGREGSIARFVL